MATYTKFQDFVEQLGLGTHNLNTDTIKAALTNSAPNATDTQLSQITQISSGTGYTTGGNDTTNTYSESGGTGTLAGVDVVFTATGTMGPFRYVVLYNDTAASDNLIGYYDRGSSLTLENGDTFTVNFGANIFTIS